MNRIADVQTDATIGVHGNEHKDMVKYSMAPILHPNSDIVENSDKAWEKGAPKAATIEQARAEWSLFLPRWSAVIEKDFSSALTYRTGRERIGWIDDASFWFAFWIGYANSSVSGKSQQDQFLHMKPYIESAAYAGSMQFFLTMPHDAMWLVNKTFLTTDALLDPNVVAWYLADRKPLLTHVMDMSLRQLLLLTSTSWSTGTTDAIGSNWKFYTTEQAIDVVCRATAMHKLRVTQLCPLIGSLILNLPNYVDRKEVVEHLIRKLSALPVSITELDVSLIALCSGYDVGGLPIHSTIAQLGKRLVHENVLSQATPISKSVNMDMETEAQNLKLLTVLSMFETIEKPIQLYNAVLSFELQRVAPKELTDLDGQLFSLT